MTPERESKLLYDEDGQGHLRVLRGVVEDPGPDSTFICVHRRDGDIYLRKSEILRIQMPSGPVGRPAPDGDLNSPHREVREPRERKQSVGDLWVAL